jgi:DNA polymerase-3 subunit alpha
MPDEDSGQPKVADGAKEIVGGMILEKTIKYTKNNKVMAFLTLEDLVGSVEVVVFPRDYEKYSSLLEEDGKIFVQGRVTAEDDKPSKMICEKVWSFDSVARELWVQFGTKSDYEREEGRLFDLLADSDGNDSVVIYVREPKAIKRLPASRNVQIGDVLLRKLWAGYGRDNVKVVEKSIEK